MGKYFYNDPIEAGYMAKHYGMRFRIECQPHYIVKHPISSNAVHEGKWYIDVDSEFLLVPEVGDAIEYIGAVLEQRFTAVRENEPRLDALHKTFAHYKLAKGEGKIIQRNGKPFFWPEQEREIA